MDIKKESKLLLAGGVSRALAVSILYPVDTIKSRLQYSMNNPFMPQALYKGYRYTIATQSIYGMLVFGTYENLKLHQDSHSLHILFCTAVISDLIGSVFLCPCEVMKQNIQIGRYQSVSHAIQNTKGLGGFYKGYSGLIARDLPFRAIQLPLYDKLKEHRDNSFLNGAIAGMTAAAVTNPIDVIKTHMMCGIECNSVKDAVTRIYAINGGLKGFVKGLPQRVVYLGGMSSIFFIVFEKIKEILMN